ncbi:MAG: DNA-methyltransferase [Planctomycetota bacterium]|jgi:site-specific DNA-methyltransferase (adenine-specific)
MSKIIFADNIDALKDIKDGSAHLIYIDPPFNTGKIQKRKTIRTVQDNSSGDRVGFKGRRYRTQEIGTKKFADVFDNFLEFLVPRVCESYRILSPTGSFFLHIDSREVHYCKVMLDSIFGRKCFMNEIIWAYDYGGRSRKKWPTKHDNILWYVKDPKNYTFNYDEMERIPYMAPGLVGKQKAERGKTPTDVWWHTIVPTSGKEKTGYPTQKPLGILKRIVKVHSNPGEVCLDFFAGSGALGEAAARLDRRFILIDNNPEAIRVMRKRLKFAKPKIINRNHK